MRSLVLLVLALLAGCAPEPLLVPTTPRYLADVDEAVRGLPGEAVLTDGTRVSLARFLQVGPDSLVGSRDPSGAVRVAIPLADVHSLRVRHDTQRADRTALCTMVAAAPAAVYSAASCAAWQSGESSYCVSNDDYRTFAYTLAGVAVGCGAVGYLVGGATRAPLTTIPIAPLSQFADAPRGGVGLRE